MKNKLYNLVQLEGRLYDHTLEKKVTGPTSKTPNSEYITGTVKIATDEDMMNVVEVVYRFVSPTTKKGENKTYIILNNIIEEKLHTVANSSKEEATFVKVDSAIGLNDFYTVDKSTNQEVLVSAKRVEGGFIHTIMENELSPNENDRSFFRLDMIMTGCTRKEANEERGIGEKLILKGAIFDFKKSLLPIELSVVHPGAMDYFESLDISSKNPVFTQVKGKIVSETVVRTITEESAFGDPSVRTVKSTNKDYVINWALPEPYEWDSETTITAQELQEAMQEREVYLAEVKRKADEYKANKNNTFTQVAATANDDDNKVDYNF